MNAKVKLGGVITLPTDVVEALKLEPGSEVSFIRGPSGFVLDKVPKGPKPTRDQVRDRLSTAAKAARTGLSKEFADMTTDEFMEFIRGD
jgi:bifunctional DNA-binding transcriptional regulator/antitoxin component of YhaV-PrlF toxin-antitoxin module